jgi:HK97 gp10 family phage protein
MAIAGTRVQGLDKLNRKLRDMPEATQAAIRKSFEGGAQEMVDMARRLAPIKTGALQRSIDWNYGAAPKGSFGVGSRSTAPDSITIHAGDKDAFYARWVEFGTAVNPAQPFFFPAWRSVRKKVMAANKRAMSKVARKVAAGGQ